MIESRCKPQRTGDSPVVCELPSITAISLGPVHRDKRYPLLKQPIHLLFISAFIQTSIIHLHRLIAVDKP